MRMTGRPGSASTSRPANRPRLLTVVVASTLLALALTPNAGAERDQTSGNSSSKVTGRGDILTTIISGLKRKTSNRNPGKANTSPPRCRNIKLKDGEIEMLVALVGHTESSGEAGTPFQVKLAEVFREALLTDFPDAPDGPGSPDMPVADMPAVGLADAPANEVDVFVRQCGVDLVDVWTTPRPIATSIAGQLLRSMVTRLPEPIIDQSPSITVSVPVGQPVFASARSSNWQTVEATLVASGITAEVRATPKSLRIYSGEPGARFVTCEGRGLAFDPTSTASPRSQARSAGACVLKYRLASSRRGNEIPSWLGSATIIWEAQWRTGNGPWRSLGQIPRTRLFERRTAELGSIITRTYGPTRAGTR